MSFENIRYVVHDLRERKDKSRQAYALHLQIKLSYKRNANVTPEQIRLIHFQLHVQ